MSDNVSRDDFNSHLELIHRSIRDNNSDANTNFNKVIVEIAQLARQSNDTRTEILIMQKEQNTRLDNHQMQITDLKGDVKILNHHKTNSITYWRIMGFSIVLLSGFVTKLLYHYFTS